MEVAITSLTYDPHALRRMAQRNLNVRDLNYVYCNGYDYQCAGAIHIFLRRKDIPRTDLKDSKKSRLEGTTVLLDPETYEVLTAYRNKRAWKKDRKKAKYLRK